MSRTSTRTRRRASAVILSCALLAAPLTAAAPARPAGDARTASALAQQDYYASYGEPEPVSPADSGGTPWLPVAGLGGVALALAGAVRPGVRRVRARRAAARIAA